MTSERLNWLEWRRLGIGSSDVAAILGESPYANILDIYMSKINPVEEKEPNYVMQLGITLEPIARSYYEIVMDADFPPANFVHASKPHLRVSLDGYNLEQNKVIEIKYSGFNFTEEIPKKYIAQVQYQYLVSNCSSLDMVQINNMNKIHIIPVERNDEYIYDMLKKVDHFWQCVLDRNLEGITAMVPVKIKKVRKKREKI